MAKIKRYTTLDGGYNNELGFSALVASVGIILTITKLPFLICRMAIYGNSTEILTTQQYHPQF